MKKLLLLGLVATISVSAYAQFQMGPAGGLSINSARIARGSGDAVEEADKYKNSISSQSGYNLGLVMSTGGKIFSFQPEILLAKRGFVKSGQEYVTENYSDNIDVIKVKLALAPDMGDVTYSNLFLDVKFMFNFGYGGENWRAFAQLGPSVNVMLNRKRVDAAGNTVIMSDENFDKNGTYYKTGELRIPDETQDFVYDVPVVIGVTLGLGGKYKAGPGWIMFNPRYEWGFTPTNVYDTGSNGYAKFEKGMSFNLGYLFEF